MQELLKSRQRSAFCKQAKICGGPLPCRVVAGTSETRLAVVRVLLYHGSDPSILCRLTDGRQMTLFHLAVKSSDHQVLKVGSFMHCCSLSSALIGLIDMVSLHLATLA